MSQETVAAQDMLTRFAHWRGRAPESVAADTTYGNGEFLQWLADRSITPYMRTRDSIHRKNSPFYGPERFTYQPESNSYRLPCRGATELWRRQHAEPHLCLYRDSQTLRCLCAKSPMHQRNVSLSGHPHGGTRPAARPRVGQHTRVGPRTAAQKEGRSFVCGTRRIDIGLRRLRLRRLKFVREQFFLAAVARNIKRLVRFLSKPTTPVLPATT